MARFVRMEKRCWRDRYSQRSSALDQFRCLGLTTPTPDNKLERLVYPFPSCGIDKHNSADRFPSPVCSAGLCQSSLGYSPSSVSAKKETHRRRGSALGYEKMRALPIGQTILTDQTIVIIGKVVLIRLAQTSLPNPQPVDRNLAQYATVLLECMQQSCELDLGRTLSQLEKAMYAEV